MIVERRKFLSLLGAAAGAAGLEGCSRPWQVPDRLVELALRGPGLESEAHSICGLCEGGCGLTVRLIDGVPVGLKGNRNHPLNRGGLCPVGMSGLEVLYAPSRLTGPLRRGADGAYRSIGWEDALTEIADRISRIWKAGQGHRIALLSGEPSALLNDLARRFARALGSPNFAHAQNGRVLPYQLTQGLGREPGFDLPHSDLVLSFGLDLYEDGPAPMHAVAAMIGNRPDESTGSVIHVGTRLSPSAAKAERYVAVRPGTHAAFALGVAHVLVREGRYNRRFVAEHTFGFEDWSQDGRSNLGFRRLLLERYYPDRVAMLCGCEVAAIVGAARRFAEASTPVAVAGGEARHGSNATWNVVAAHALNALVGAFDRPGGVILPASLPLTPLPSFKSADEPESILAASQFPGTDPVEALVDRSEGPEGIDVLFVAAANPVYENPAGKRFRGVMERIPTTVALAPFLDETSGCADFVLPTPHFLESWPSLTSPPTVPFSFLGLAKPVVEPLFDTRHAGDVMLELSRRAGVDSSAMPWSSYEDYLRSRLQGLMVSAQGSIISGSFEESWKHFLEERGWRFLERGDADNFWNDLTRHAGWLDPVLSSGDWARMFPTPSGRFEFFSQTLASRLRQLGGSDDSADATGALRNAIRHLRLQADPDEVCLPHFEPPLEAGDGPVTLIPFRPLTARSSWGTASPMVMEMFGYPVLSGWATWAEFSEQTARQLGIEHGDEISLESQQGSITAEVRVRTGAAAGAVHVPLGLGRVAPETAQQVGSNPVETLLPIRDPLTGALSLNSTRVRVRLLRRRSHGGPPPAHGGKV